MSTQDRQSHPRRRGRIRVRFGTAELERSAFTMNVSLSGAFIRTNQVYAPGTTIKVEFNFDDGPLTLHAKVVWAKRVPPQMAHLVLCGMGIRLVQVGPEWKTKFEAWEAGH